MKRIVLAAVLAAFGATAVIAQGDPIAARKALMKGNNDNARNVVRMTRGEDPYDAAKVNAAFAQWDETAKKFGALFPENSKTGQQTRASAKIWETRADFDAKLASFAKAVTDNRDKAKNLDELKVALAAVGKTCDDCHGPYRAPQQR